MGGFVIAVSGGIGAGKTELAKHLEKALDADRVSFGDEVRTFARENGQDENDRSVLQRLGQALVLSQCKAFVTRVLAQRPSIGRTETRLIIEGVRHVEVLKEIMLQMPHEHVRLVHIATPETLREQRIMDRDNVERRVVARYDNDITEAQISRILPQYADLIVEGDLPVSLQISAIKAKLGEWTSSSRELEDAG